jgi:hypothetical protein
MEGKIMTPAEIKATLRQYSGTEHYYAHFTGGGKLVYTDGVKAMAEMCGAYWLIDEIMLSQREKSVIDYNNRDGLQFWILKHSADHEETGHWSLTMEDGNDNVIFSKIIGFSDFPLDEITLFFGGNTCGVLYLPSEH